MFLSLIIGKLLEWHLQENYIKNEDNNVIQECSTSIILLIFMSDTIFLYLSNEGYFTLNFIIHHFVWFAK